MQVAGVVDAAVVEAAEGKGVFEIGGSVGLPGSQVVELAPGVGAFAAVGGATGVAQAEGGALGGGGAVMASRILRSIAAARVGTVK